MDSSHRYIAEFVGQLGLIDVFLGGVAVTLMSILLAHERRQRRIGVAIVLAAGAAVAFIIGVMGATQLQMSYNPDIPANLRTTRQMLSGQLAGVLGMGVGMICLFACIGVCGWIRSPATGWATTAISVIGLLAAGWIALN